MAHVAVDDLPRQVSHPRYASLVVVNEDRCAACFYIVGVGAGDGEVVYGWVSWPAAGLGDAECLAGGGA